MSAHLCRRVVIAVAAAILMVPGRASAAQVLTTLDGNVQAYFSANNDALGAQQSDPGGLTPWIAAGYGPYSGQAVPTVPGPPSSPLYPSLLPTSNSFYSIPYTSTFTDIPTSTTATSVISASAPGGTSVASANVQTNFTLNDPVSRYAYEQLDFALDYGYDGILSGGILGAPSFLVSGTTTGTGAYAQLGGQINYYWHPSDATWTLSGGGWILLGSLDYNWQTSGAGTFSTIVSPTGILNPTQGSYGVLEMFGDIFVAGDPASINVESVPEPSSWLLFGIGLVALCVWPLMRRRATTV